jgi:hypothetical protein
VPPEKKVEKPRRISGPLLERGEGYIDVSDKYKTRLELGTAKLVRPGLPPIDLGIPADAVLRPVYLSFYDKYLTTSYDYQSIATAIVKGSYQWRGHRSNAPYYLVGLDGSVDTVPYPEVIFQYAANGAQIRSFSYLWPTPHGVLIDVTGGPYSPVSGLFLLKGEELFRIWGGPPSLNPFTRGRSERLFVLDISPDGCRVVFLHAHKYPLPRDKNPDPIPMSVLNICKEQ